MPADLIPFSPAAIPIGRAVATPPAPHYPDRPAVWYNGGALDGRMMQFGIVVGERPPSMPGVCWVRDPAGPWFGWRFTARAG